MNSRPVTIQDHVEKANRVAHPISDFTIDAVLGHPGELLARAGQAGPRKRIGIIGAGIAGLAAAYELERVGHTVQILESSDRIGGRIRTHTFSDGSTGELGAMRIPTNHAGVLHYIHQFGLATRPFVNRNPAAYYLMRGRKARVGDWAAIAQRYRLSRRERRNPLLLFEQCMTSALERLSVDEKWSIFSPSPKGVASTYDRISLRQYMASQGVSDEVFEYMGHANGMFQYERASFLECLLDHFGLQRVAQLELVNGMESLVHALGQRIRNRPELQTTVVQVSVSDESVIVHGDRKGATVSSTFDYVLCTAPAAATARIDFTPELPYEKMQALRGLYHASAAKTIVHTTSRPWETVDGIYGGGSFSDLPFQQCWYPSDNAISRRGDQLSSHTGADDPREAFAHAPGRWTGASADMSHQAGVLTASYTWESNARRMAALSSHDRANAVIQSLNILHPGIRDNIDDIVHITWDQEPSPGLGAFAYFAPGEHGRYHRHLTSPHPAARPRVFFAGEHTSLVHAWIQGSIESALGQAIEIMKAPVATTSSADQNLRDGAISA